MAEYRVIKSRRTPFSEPLVLEKGAAVTCGEEFSENPLWPGWIWCEARNNAGWIPIQRIDRTGNRGTMNARYDAAEFDLDPGEIIVGLEVLNGWVWGHKKSAPGAFAWAPLDYLSRIPD